MGSTAKRVGNRFTYADYLTWPAGERWEIIGGGAYAMTPAPTLRHQDVSGNIFARFKDFFRGNPCKPFYAPTDVVFDRYATIDHPGFYRTHVPVFLVRYGDENLVSRSQAKRVLARVERFMEVVLDFRGVSQIGQAFADEIFRVFRLEHPEVNLMAINTNAEIDWMIRRAQNQA